VLEYCEKQGLAFIPWFPVAAGKLAQPGSKLDTIAKRHGATVAQLSIAWLLYRSPVMLPIPGTSSVAHLKENLKAAEIFLSHAELKEIERAAG
jgi:pyridoxine 4-dehydrogenase